MPVGDRTFSRNSAEALVRKILALLRAGGVTQFVDLDDGDTEAVAQRETVEDKTDDYTLDEEDFGKLLTMTNAGPKIFTLPAVDAEDIGLYVSLVKRGAGKLTVQAAGGETIQDSSAGGTVYNDLAEETFALVRLCVIAAGKWIIEHFTGSGWRTS